MSVRLATLFEQAKVNVALKPKLQAMVTSLTGSHTSEEMQALYGALLMVEINNFLAGV